MPSLPLWIYLPSLFMPQEIIRVIFEKNMQIEQQLNVLMKMKICNINVEDTYMIKGHFLKLQYFLIGRVWKTGDFLTFLPTKL